MFGSFVRARPGGFDEVVLLPLRNTSITTDIIEDLQSGWLQKIEIEYTFELSPNETLVHLFQFYTNEFGEWGSAWDDFVTLITAEENEDAVGLIYYAKRSYAIMSEFTQLWLESQQHAAAA